MGEAINAGQSTDPIKEAILRPAVLEAICDEIIPGEKLKIIDIGTGDGSFTLQLVEALPVGMLGLVEPDETAFGPFLANSRGLGSLKINPLYGEWQAVEEAYFNSAYEEYDIALTQLVLHHIHTDHEAFEFGVRAFDLLKDGGSLIMINLHPDYIKFLLENEPEKLQPCGNGFMYRFGDGLSNFITPRSTESILTMFDAIGFDLDYVRDLGVEPLRTLKSRFATMARTNTSMFELIKLRKKKQRLVRQTSGTVVARAFIEPGHVDFTLVSNQIPQIVRLPIYGAKIHPIRSDDVTVREVLTGVSRVNTWILRPCYRREAVVVETFMTA